MGQALFSPATATVAPKEVCKTLREDLEDNAPEVLENEDIAEDVRLIAEPAEAGSKLAVEYLQFTKVYNCTFEETSVNALLTATAMHPCGGGWGFRPFLQLMTRYSQFLWHEDLKPMREAYRRFSVDSLRELWWEECCYERDTPQYRESVIHLVNSPEAETAHVRIAADPPKVDDAEVCCLGLKSPAGVRAWAIQPYGHDATRLEPTQTELKGGMVEGELVFAVPAFTYYTMVVIRQEKK